MEQAELQLGSKEMEGIKGQLQEIIKPWQQEQNRRQKKSDFLAKCVRCIEKNDFFQLDELLRSRQTSDLLEEAHFQSCNSIFNALRTHTQTQVDSYLLKFKDALLQLAQEAGLPMTMDFPRFSVLKGIEGEVDFSARCITINQTTIKSLDPRRLIAAAVKIKRSLYDSPFEPQEFIDSLLQCYREILKKESLGMGAAVPMHQLYTDYVWSLQNKTFFQNMDKGKFIGCSLEQFSVNFWRYFQSSVKSATGGYRIKLSPGRGKYLWLIDQTGERRQITNVEFLKTEES
jgi:hypothetical protein